MVSVDPCKGNCRPKRQMWPHEADHANAAVLSLQLYNVVNMRCLKQTRFSCRKAQPMLPAPATNKKLHSHKSIDMLRQICRSTNVCKGISVLRQTRTYMRASTCSDRHVEAHTYIGKLSMRARVCLHKGINMLKQTR
eukprot:469147-Pelagomonas_calceolata.AAC.1